jgi:hypothetical protein
VKDDESSRCAALEQGGEAEAGGKGGEAVVERLAEQLAQIWSESAQNPAVDHVQAPQQQCHATHQIEKDHCSHARYAQKSSRKERLSVNCRRSNPYFPESLVFGGA